MNTISYLKYTILSISIGLISCKHDHPHGEADHMHDEYTEDDYHDYLGVTLTPAQAKTIGLEFGSFSKAKVNDFVKATGTLGIPSNGLISVSPKESGIIRSSIKLVDGDFIKKGTLIAFVENSDLLMKQQEYLQTGSELKFLGLELERQQKLVHANAGKLKDLQKLQTDYDVKQARLSSLKKYFDYVGVPSSKIGTDDLKSSVPIYATATGYITSINFHNGMHVEKSAVLLDILDNSHLHLELDVFEKDVAYVKPGQKISYMVPALGDEIYSGEVSVIGKEFNVENKTLRVHGHLDEEKPQFIKDLFVNAKIWMNDVMVNVLPEQSIILDGQQSYIYAANPDTSQNITFSKLMVKTGSSENGYTAVELIDPIPDSMALVIEGAYYIYAKSKAGELEHDH